MSANRWRKRSGDPKAIGGVNATSKYENCIEVNLVFSRFIKSGPKHLSRSLPEFGLSPSVSLLRLSMEMLSLMSLMYESSSDT